MGDDELKKLAASLAAEMGRRGMRLLLEAIDAGASSTSGTTLLPVKLVIRQSTAKKG